MTSSRNLLLIALLFTSYLMWMQWQEDYHRPPATAPVATTAPAADGEVDPSTPSAVPGVDLPPASAVATPPEAVASEAVAPAGERIVVTTDVLRVEIDSRGGNVVVADLLDYLRDPKHPDKVRLLDDQPATFFEAQVGLVGVQGSTIAAPDHNALFVAERTDYTLEPGS